jgi:hypothetical protein
MNRKRLLEVMKPILSDGGYRDLEMWSEGNKKVFIFFDSTYMIHPESYMFQGGKYYRIDKMSFTILDSICVK